MVDMVVHRHELRATLVRHLCRLLTKAPAHGRPTPRPPAPRAAKRRRRGAGQRLSVIASTRHAQIAASRAIAILRACRPSTPSSTRLLALHPKLIDLSLDRMWRLLAALGHPERKLPPVIHVAGTNGKGSTIAFMRAILEAAGLRVHVYTSPHLVRFNERFRLGAVGERQAGHRTTSSPRALEECERANAGEPITVFEITTAAGLLLFSRHPADVLLLEVGLGGRLDATNVVEQPLATVDHAGVVRPRRVSRRHASPRSRPRRPASSSAACRRSSRAQPREALAVIERAAARARRADPDRRRGLDRDRGARPAGLSGRCRPARSAGAAARRAATSSRMRASRSRRCARAGAQRCRRRRSRPARQGGMAGAHAAAVARHAARRCCRPAASCGSTAATMPTAAAPSPTRSPISRSGCRARWC